MVYRFLLILGIPSFVSDMFQEMRYSNSSAGFGNLKFREERMTKKIVDLMSYKIEKELKESGFTVKRDGDKKVKLLIKLKNDGTDN